MNLALVLMESGGYVPPSVESFKFEGNWGIPWMTKPMMLIILATIITLVFWVVASRRLQVSPTKGQFFVEYLYDFIRNGIGREMLGGAYRQWTPLLVGLFTWILINNWFGEFFLFMFPSFSNIGYVYGVVAVVLITYIAAGFHKQGWRYLVNSVIPPGVPWYLMPIIIPVEFLSNFVTRPVTLAVRLFANMFAGHMSVMVFVVGGTFLLTAGQAFLTAAGAVSLVFSLAIMGLELLIGFLQAYIFTILTAQYISSSVAPEH